MASIKGIVTGLPPATYGHELLLDKLIEFLTTNSDLVSLNQQWEVLSDNHAAIDADRFVYLKGKGLSGTDEIFVNIRRYTILTGVQPVYNWEIRGAQNYDSGLTFDKQPGVSFRQDFILYDEDMPYWMFANGRRFIINARVLSYHVNIYCGLYLPYATSSEFPYPLAILATTDVFDKSYLSGAGDDLSGFFNPKTTKLTALNSPTAGSVLEVNGKWKGVVNKNITYSTGEIYRLVGLWPYYNFDVYNSTDTFNIRGNIDGTFPLFPIIIMSADAQQRPSGNLNGELDGVFAVSGGPYVEKEDTFTIGSDTYLAIGDGEDFSLAHMAAIKEG